MEMSTSGRTCIIRDQNNIRLAHSAVPYKSFVGWRFSFRNHDIEQLLVQRTLENATFPERTPSPRNLLSGIKE